MQKNVRSCELQKFENSLTTVKVMTKTKVALFYLGHGVFPMYLKFTAGIGGKKLNMVNVFETV